MCLYDNFLTGILVLLWIFISLGAKWEGLFRNEEIVFSDVVLIAVFSLRFSLSHTEYFYKYQY